MVAERDIGRLLAGLSPALCGRDWGYATATVMPAGLAVFATVAEDEGLTLIAPMADLQAAGLDAQGPMARITLTIHSALEAVGLTAAVSAALAQEGISANMVAGFYHDHIFLPAADADRAMAVLKALSDA
jgi:uncharacterized protein